MSALYAADMGDPADLVVDVLEYRDHHRNGPEALVLLDVDGTLPYVRTFVSVAALEVRAA